MSENTLFKSLKLNGLGFGCASISGEGGGYGFGDMSEKDALSLLSEAYELGLRLFDTAPIYGFGESERRLGKAFKKKAEEVFVISKCGVTWHDNQRVNMTNDPKVAEKMLHQSLKDLQIESIDLYMVHWPDEKVDIRYTLEPLVKAQEVGKIKHLGLCNTYAEDMVKASEVADIRVVQNQLNLFERGVLPLVEELAQKDISFMSWGTFDKGILTGRVNSKRTFDSSDCRAWAPWWKAMKKDGRYQAVAEITRFLAKDKDNPVSLSALALAHNLSITGVDVALCGMKNSEQLHDAIRASKIKVSSDVIDEALEIAKKYV